MQIHPLADVQTTAIGEGTFVWQFAVILKGATIGKNCNINCHTFIENDVVVGNNVTVKAGVYLWDGLVVADDVFIGPNATFTNDKYPRSKQYPDGFQKTALGYKSSIGANATILGGVQIGRFAIVGAGAVVTKNVPDYALITGNPGKITGWVDETGNKLQPLAGHKFQNAAGDQFELNGTTLTPTK